MSKDEEKKERVENLLRCARQICMVTPAMVREAAALQTPMRNIWFAAGEGLAIFHNSRGRVYDDIRGAFGCDAEQLPQAYFDGYDMERLRAQYALA